MYLCTQNKCAFLFKDMAQYKGKIAQVIGPVVDVTFSSEKEMPKIYDSLEDVDCYNMKPQYLRKTEAERELENDKNK